MTAIKWWKSFRAKLQHLKHTSDHFQLSEDKTLAVLLEIFFMVNLLSVLWEHCPGLSQFPEHPADAVWHHTGQHRLQRMLGVWTCVQPLLLLFFLRICLRSFHSPCHRNTAGFLQNDPFPDVLQVIPWTSGLRDDRVHASAVQIVGRLYQAKTCEWHSVHADSFSSSPLGANSLKILSHANNQQCPM